MSIPDTELHQGVDKIARHGWVSADQPGDLRLLHKQVLKIDPQYQRDLIYKKALQIAANWSWISFGAIVVAERGGQYLVIDGQHRLGAALRRSDITLLPCIVFRTRSAIEEAKGFLGTNVGRKPVDAFAQFKAKITSGDDVASWVNETCRMLGITITKSASAAGQLKCLSLCLRRATEDREKFLDVLSFAQQLSVKDGVFIHERLLDGLWHLNGNCGDGLSDRKLRKRLLDKGARALVEAANRASAYYAKGGAKVWATGMLQEINRGLQKKFQMQGAED